MADPLGIAAPPVALPGGTLPGVIAAAAGSAPVAELLTAPPAAAYAAAVISATVIARAVDTLLVQTALGNLSLKTPLFLPAGTTLALRLLPGAPPSAQLLRIEPPAPGTAEAGALPPATQLAEAAKVLATVRPPLPSAVPLARGAVPLPVGTQLVLKPVGTPSAPAAASDGTLVTGEVVAAGGTETLVQTPLGLLKVESRLGLAPGTRLAFERLATTPPPAASDDPPSRAGGWPALDQALGALDRAAPAVASQLRAALTPQTPQQLAGTLLFLTQALYGRGSWPDGAVGNALAATGHDKLREKLIEDADELRQIAASPATGEWRTLVLPLLDGAAVQPVRLYLKRRKGSSTPGGNEEGTRFIVEVEMSRLGPLQLDGLLKSPRFDLVLRSHRPFPPELKNEASAIFHQALANENFSGDIAFVTASPFAVAPLAKLRSHVQVRA